MHSKQETKKPTSFVSFCWILEVVRHLGYKFACYLKLPGLMKTHHPWMSYKS